MSLYDEKKQMYADYCKEIEKFYEEPPVGMNIDDDFRAYTGTKDCSWRNIFAKDGTLAGFLVIGKGGHFCHENASRAICEAYVKPEYRGQGLMTEEASGYLSRHPGTFSLLILKKNDYAKAYWEKVFRNAGFKPVELSSSDISDDIVGEVDLYGFFRNR